MQVWKLMEWGGVLNCTTMGRDFSIDMRGYGNIISEGCGFS